MHLNYRCNTSSFLYLKEQGTRLLLSTLMFMIMSMPTMTIIAQPSNDICTNAISLPVDGTCQVFDNTNATASNNPQEFMLCGFAFDPALDMWFSIVAPNSGNFTIEVNQINPNLNNMTMDLYDGTCSSLSAIECADRKNTSPDYFMPIIERENMVAGQTYWIRVSANFFDFGQFEICVSDQGYNNFPCRIELMEATGQSVCDPATNTYTQELTIHYRDNSGVVTDIYLNQEFYPIQPSPMIINIPDIPANSGYQSLFAQFAPFGQCANEAAVETNLGFQRQANCFSGTVVNDDCSGATVISADNMCVSVTGNNLGATSSTFGGFCENSTQGEQDVWFQHTTTNTDDIIVNAWSNLDVIPSYIVYRGTCSQLNYEGCAFEYNSIRLTGLSIGETIFIQIKDNRDDVQGDFNLCLIHPVPSTNDICQNAIAVPTSTNCNISSVYSNHLAIDESNGTQPSVCNNSNNEVDLWYEFIVPATGFLAISMEPVVIDDYEYYYAIGELYEGSCSSLVLVDCKFLDRSSNIEVLNRTPGETLYLRVMQSFQFKPYLICTPEISNDFCQAAEEIAVGTCIMTDNFGNTPSDNPYPGLLCGTSGIGQDVWYSAIVPSSGNMTIESFEVSNGLSNLNIEVYTGMDCNNLSPLACSDTKDINTNFSNHAKIELEGQTPGERIYIRVIERGGNSEGEFELCVTDAGYSELCKIELIESVGQSSCDPITNISTQDLLVTYRHDGTATHIQINGENYVLTSSPQLISIELPAIGNAYDLYTNLLENFNYTSCSATSSYFARDGIQTSAPCFNGTVSNDDCINAISLPVSKGCLAGAYDNTGSTFSPEGIYACNGGFGSQTTSDIWFEVVVPQSGELIINSYQLSQMFPAFEIYEGPCNNLSLIANCGNNDNSVRFSGRQAGEILYIQAYTLASLSQGVFGLCAIEPEANSNDTCNDAVDVAVNSSCAQQVYSTHFANVENSSINCNGSSYDAYDIWFNVIVPNSGNVSLYTDEIERGNSDMIMEVFAGNCQSPFSTCAVSNSAGGNAEIILTGIPAGTQLRVRIASLYGNPASFLFCATSACPNNDVIGAISQGTRDFEADISIAGYETLSSGTDVTFDAGMMVNLDPGFEVESGAIFHAFIDGCGGQ